MITARPGTTSNFSSKCRFKSCQVWYSSFWLKTLLIGYHWKGANEICRVPWPAHNRDFYIIENVWVSVKRHLQSKAFENLKETGTNVLNAIRIIFLQNLYQSMPSRVEQIIKKPIKVIFSNFTTDENLLFLTKSKIKNEHTHVDFCLELTSATFQRPKAMNLNFFDGFILLACATSFYNRHYRKLRCGDS